MRRCAPGARRVQRRAMRSCTGIATPRTPQAGEGKPLSPLWDEAKAAALSSSPGVARVLPMGTILAVELEVEGGGGYASGAAKVELCCGVVGCWFSFLLFGCLVGGLIGGTCDVRSWQSVRAV
eukprot:386919-Rhodomonas_salina.4